MIGTKGRNSHSHYQEMALMCFKKTFAHKLIHLDEAIDNSYWESKLEDTDFTALSDHT